MNLRPHSFHPTFLREYDARGVVGKTLSPDDARALGAAFATYAATKLDKPKTKIAVGYDGRLSSPVLEEALREGLKGAGADVLRVGLGPTPMLYFAVKHEKCDAGVMITGSHNPPDYNGFKMLLSTGPVYGQMIQELGC
jgi:phosphomannomutase